MALSDIVNITVTAATKTPAVDDFGTMLLVGYHTRWGASPDRSRQYSSLPAMVSDSFVVADPLYKMAAACFSQSPRPSKVKIGRRALAYTHTVTLTMTSDYTIDGARTTSVSVDGLAIPYTFISSDTTTTIAATSFAAAITTAAPAGITVSHSGAVVTLAASSANGVYHQFSAWTPDIQFADTTADSGNLATDLNAIYLQDKNWYAMALDAASPNQLSNGAAWLEALGFGLYAAQSADYAITTSSTGDAFTALKNSTYKHTAPLFYEQDTHGFAAAGWMASFLTTTPGAATMAFKSVAGVSVDATPPLDDTRVSHVFAKNGSVYTTLAGQNFVQGGKVSSGDWADTTRFIDWCVSTIRTNLVALLLNNDKIPFTDKGIFMVKNVVQGVLTTGVNNGGFVAGTTYVTAPAAGSVSTTDKGNRNLPGVEAGGELAGAIHSIQLNLQTAL